MNNLIRNFGEPDEVVEFGGATEQLISIGGLTISRSVQPAGLAVAHALSATRRGRLVPGTPHRHRA